MTDLLLGVDIGATGIKTGFFQPDGTLAALAGRRNGPVAQPHGEPGWLIWNAADIWSKVCECIQECLPLIGDPARVRAVACTGFGADGVPMSKTGELLYPFISWHDSRTAPQSRELSRSVGDMEIFRRTGYHNYPINTLNRLLWHRQNQPEILRKTHRWLQMQDFIAFKFSGEFSTECTIASTTMMLDMATRTWSKAMLDAAGIDPAILPDTREAGTRIGEVTAQAARETGLKAGTPVVTGGHDCEIAVLGAGVNEEGTLIDITGTWEILIATLNEFRPEPAYFERGLDFECHALPGKWICQSLMIAGGVIEWVRGQFYGGHSPDTVYETMFSDAEAALEGVYVLPSFMRGMGPMASQFSLGTILGLTTAATRGQIVRATLEGLCFQLRQQVEALQEVTHRKADRLRVVGGGQKNTLWLQMKADMTGLPVEITTNPEVTLLGVAMLAGIGAGLYRDISGALRAITFPIETYEPHAASHQRYAVRYEKVFSRIAPDLREVYEALQSS